MRYKYALSWMGSKIYNVWGWLDVPVKISGYNVTTILLANLIVILVNLTTILG